VQFDLGLRRWDRVEAGLQRTTPSRWQVDGMPYCCSYLDAHLMEEIVRIIDERCWISFVLRYEGY
jgi:hypothetical protein